MQPSSKISVRAWERQPRSNVSMVEGALQPVFAFPEQTLVGLQISRYQVRSGAMTVLKKFDSVPAGLILI